MVFIEIMLWLLIMGGLIGGSIILMPIFPGLSMLMICVFIILLSRVETEDLGKITEWLFGGKRS